MGKRRIASLPKLQIGNGSKPQPAPISPKQMAAFEKVFLVTITKNIHDQPCPR